MGLERKVAAEPRIALASQSPRRRELLRQIGVPFTCLRYSVDERLRQGESPRDYVRRMAEEKASGAAARHRPSVPTLSADTVVVLGDAVLGKPGSYADALGLLERLSGREHEVFTAVALVADRTEIKLSESRVWLRETTLEERRAYCDTGEPMDKAGAYAIQGLAAVFVRRLEGSYSGVMGLPLYETAALLAGAGIHII